MSRQRYRRRLRRTVNALGVGTSLVVGGGSISWAQAAGRERFPAFLGVNARQCQGHENARNPLFRRGFGAVSHAAPVATTKPISRSSQSTACGAFREGVGKDHHTWPQARDSGVSPRRENMSHVSGHQNWRLRSVRPLQATSVLLHDEPTFFGGRQPLTSRAVRWLISRSILSRAKASAGLTVEVEARSNREAVSGRFDTVSVEFQELIFDDIQVTGGARFEVLGVDLLTPGLLPGPMRRLRRLRRPCEVTSTFDLTNADLMYSPAIRRLAQHVVNHAVRPRRSRRGLVCDDDTVSGGGGGGGGGRDKVMVAEATAAAAAVSPGSLEEARFSVSRVFLHGSKLAVEGAWVSGAFFRLPFRYDFSLSASRDGHVLQFKDPSVYCGAPGLEWHVPMPPLQSFNVDMGDRAKIEHLGISTGCLALRGRFILSPVAPLMVSPGYKRGNVQHDLAETLSRVICDILRFRRE